MSEGFLEKCKIPHCVGTIDARHVRIKKPAHSGSLYYNYKRFFSIGVQAVVDSNYRFIFIDVGSYGSQHDSTTFKNSEFYKALKLESLCIPGKRSLQGCKAKLPFYFIGDGAYPFMEMLMKPYAGYNLSEEQSQYNKKISGARVCSENAFGHKCQKWRIYYTTIQTEPEVVELIIKSTSILHNILIDLGDININHSLIPSDLTDAFLPAKNGTDNDEDKGKFIIGKPERIRNDLVDYFEYQSNEEPERKKRRYPQ